MVVCAVVVFRVLDETSSNTQKQQIHKHNEGAIMMNMLEHMNSLPVEDQLKYWNALLTEKQAAEETGFTIRAFQAWRHRGGGPSFLRISSRAIRYRRSDIRSWYETKLASSTAA